MKSLYNIQNEYLELAARLEEEELTPEMEELLTINKNELQVKCSSYIGVIAEFEAQVQMAKEAERRAKEFRARKEKVIENLKARLLDAVKLYGNQTIETVELKTRKSQSVQIIDESKIPAEFKTLEMQKVVNKVALKKALKDGEVPGAIIVENQNLVIK